MNPPFNKQVLAPPRAEVAPSEASASGALRSKWLPGDAAGGQWGNTRARYSRP